MQCKVDSLWSKLDCKIELLPFAINFELHSLAMFACDSLVVIVNLINRFVINLHQNVANF